MEIDLLVHQFDTEIDDSRIIIVKYDLRNAVVKEVC